MYSHLDWANDRVVQGLADAGHFESGPIDLFAHILGAEDVWLSRIENVSPAPPVWPKLSLRECRDLTRKNVERFKALLDRLRPSDLKTRVSYVSSLGDRFDSTIEDILIHVAMHGSYHRGQVALMLRSGGDKPVTSDYIAFTRGAPAAVKANE